MHEPQTNIKSPRMILVVSIWCSSQNVLRCHALERSKVQTRCQCMHRQTRWVCSVSFSINGEVSQHPYESFERYSSTGAAFLPFDYFMTIVKHPSKKCIMSVYAIKEDWGPLSVQELEIELWCFSQAHPSHSHGGFIRLQSANHIL